jgi:hypothetical protein
MNKKSINQRNEQTNELSFHAVINPPGDRIGLIRTQNNFQYTQNIDRVFLVRAGISVLEQEVA